MLKAWESASSKDSRPGIGSSSTLPIGKTKGWACANCGAVAPSGSALSCKSCKHQGFPVEQTDKITITYGGSSWELVSGGWSCNGVSAEDSGMMSTYGVDVSSLAEAPPGADMIVGEKDACDFPASAVRRGVTRTEEGVFVQDAKQEPTKAFSPVLLMQHDAINAVKKKLGSIPPSLDAATCVADNAETKVGNAE